MVNGDSQGAGETSSFDMAPPGYGDHQFDQLYSNVDPTGYITPTASGFNTPFDGHSRRTSADNLVSLGTAAHNQLMANTLHNRLNNLTNPVSSRYTRGHSSTSGPSTPTQNILEGMAGANDASRNGLATSGDYFSRRNHGSHSRNNSATFGQESSGESSGPNTPSLPSNLDTPLHLEYNNEALAKVPSYGTALRAPMPREYSGDLPNYEQASSMPPSPTEFRGASDGTPTASQQVDHHQHHHGTGLSNHENDRRVRILPVRGRY